MTHLSMVWYVKRLHCYTSTIILLYETVKAPTIKPEKDRKNAETRKKTSQKMCKKPYQTVALMILHLNRRIKHFSLCFFFFGGEMQINNNNNAPRSTGMSLGLVKDSRITETTANAAR